MEILDLTTDFGHNYIFFKKKLRGQTKPEHQ